MLKMPCKISFAIKLSLIFLMLILSSCALKNSGEFAKESMPEKWGIDVTRLSVTANGFMIDFRYKVLDAEKAKELFVRKNKPYLIDQVSGKVLEVANLGKVGPLRNSNQPKQGKIYWMFFGNTHGLVQPGSKVTVVIGDFRVEDLVAI